MIKIDIKVDTKELERRLVDAQKQIKFATARALTKTAQGASSNIRAAMIGAFDRPTQYTLNAFYAKPAKKNDLTAWVGSREYALKGRPASKYLAPEIEGTTRGFKGFENALKVISGGQYVMPGRGANLDAYGNISRGQLTQVLSRLSLLRDALQNLSQKTTDRLRRRALLVAASGMRSEYFVAREKGTGRPLGVYKLVGRGLVVPILIFVKKQPSYAVRLPFEAIVEKHIKENWEPNMTEAIDHALATARLK
jgi:hypothetical protein